LPFLPFSIRLFTALSAQFKAGFSAALVAAGQPGVADSAFMPRHPVLLREETCALLYGHTARKEQAHYWIETGYHFEVQLFAYGVEPLALCERIMWFEYATQQALMADPTVGALCTTLKMQTGQSIGIIHQDMGSLVDGMIIPVVCQPRDRIAIPERSP
jgi:hypothetical protein